MENTLTNPHAPGLKHDIWEMCVRRDLDAFLAQDWNMIADDFDSDFLGINAGGSNDPLDWIPKFPTVKSYQDEFAKQAETFAKKKFVDDALTSLNACLTLSDFRQHDERMLVVKTFDGELALADGTSFPMKWKSLFHLKCNSGTWRITGFVGYLPL